MPVFSAIPSFLYSPFNSSSGSLECLSRYEVCRDAKCASLTEAAGLDGWVIGTIAIVVVLTVKSRTRTRRQKSKPRLFWWFFVKARVRATNR